MKPVTMIGIVLIVLGALGFIFGGFSFTETEEIAQFGDVEITNQEEESFNVPPLLSGLLVIGGVVLVAVGASRS